MRILLESSYINIHGETMILKLTEDLKMQFSHDDCNTEFEDLSEMFTTIKVPLNLQKKLKVDELIQFKYILNESEKAMLDSFMVSVDKVIKERKVIKKEYESLKH